MIKQQNSISFRCRAAANHALSEKCSFGSSMGLIQKAIALVLHPINSRKLHHNQLSTVIRNKWMLWEI